jgi:methionyl-tRNA formyltransferase
VRSFLLASSKSWFSLKDLPASCSEHNWVEIGQPAELTPEFVAAVNPEFIFFPHWNARIPSEILEHWDCVVFPTAPLPFGRGGSPIQNLIERGFSSSPVHALRAVEEMDAGPILTTRQVDLSGSLGEIFSRLGVLVGDMIAELLESPIVAREQEGSVFKFQRRHASASLISGRETSREIYDKIRMVDYEDYPKAHILLGSYKLVFTDAEIDGQELRATVSFEKS